MRVCNTRRLPRACEAQGRRALLQEGILALTALPNYLPCPARQSLCAAVTGWQVAGAFQGQIAIDGVARNMMGNGAATVEDKSEAVGISLLCPDRDAGPM